MMMYRGIDLFAMVLYLSVSASDYRGIIFVKREGGFKNRPVTAGTVATYRIGYIYLGGKFVAGNGTAVIAGISYRVIWLIRPPVVRFLRFLFRVGSFLFVHGDCFYGIIFYGLRFFICTFLQSCYDVCRRVSDKRRYSRFNYINNGFRLLFIACQTRFF